METSEDRPFSHAPTEVVAWSVHYDLAPHPRFFAGKPFILSNVFVRTRRNYKMRRLSFQGISYQHMLSEAAGAMPAYEIEALETKDGGR